MKLSVIVIAIVLIAYTNAAPSSMGDNENSLSLSNRFRQLREKAKGYYSDFRKHADRYYHRHKPEIDKRADYIKKWFQQNLSLHNWRRRFSRPEQVPGREP